MRVQERLAPTLATWLEDRDPEAELARDSAAEKIGLLVVYYAERLETAAAEEDGVWVVIELRD